MLNATVIRNGLLVGFTLLASATLAETAGAQQPTQLKEGERIRVTHHRHPSGQRETPLAQHMLSLLLPPYHTPPHLVRISGSLVEAAGDTLVMMHGGALRKVPTTSIVQLHVDRGIPNRLVRPALIGAGIGAVAIGGIVWLNFMGDGTAEMSETVAGAGVGAVIGSLYGAGYGLLEPWRRVRLPVVITPSADGESRVTLGVDVRF
jgi:hypothetical protein